MNKWSLALFALLVLIASPNAQAFDWRQTNGYRWAALPVTVAGKTGFSELPSNQTGILFTNWLPQARYTTNQILLNGSGVAAGDADGDGLCDLFFCGIDRPCALYRNLGNWKFVDITAEAGVACEGQPSSGAVFGDFDGDGHLDLLVNGVGTGTRLFKNNGKGRFQETTRQAGLKGGTGSMSMALADVDGDGFLDLYVVNYRPTTFRDEPDTRFKASVAGGRYQLLAVNGRPVSEPDLAGRYSISKNMGVLENGEADVLYRNDGHGGFVPQSWTNGTFLDEDGKPATIPYDWGLSVMFRDINGDGAPDIYVCNDFHSEDRIWINDGHGRFRAIPRLALRHTSIFSMGIDFADIDRDGHDDFFVADMLSRSHERRQVQLMDRRPVQLPVGLFDNRPQYSRNTLFWNRGDRTYAEIAFYGGVEAADWAWCPVFMDVDLDGFEDLLAVTGHLRDAQNIDISRRIEAMKRQRPMSRLEQLNLRKLFTRLDIPNYAFRNKGDLTFEEAGKAWGFDSTKVSQGIALADLDNDGDLDVVVNCLDDGPLLLRNDSNRPRVSVRLRGLRPNTQGIGAKITVTQPGMPRQSQDVICGGRYLSGDDPLRVFAAAGADANLTFNVRWRNGRQSVIAGAKPNRLYEIDESQAIPGEHEKSAPSLVSRKTAPFFEDRSELLNHVHHQEPFDDYSRQPLLPWKLSQFGPGISWCDYDGDGWEDLIVPSGRGGKLAVFRNNGNGGFVPLNEPPFDAMATRDQSAVIGWTQAGGRAVLLVGSSNYEGGPTNEPVAVSYGFEGNLARDPEPFPGQSAATGPMALTVIDGETCLFVGGRVIPGRFPEPADSLFFRFHSGKFQLDAEDGKMFQHAGLVAGAIWSDIDGDGTPELVLACAGGPIRVFQREGRGFREITGTLGLGKYTGLWTGVAVGDFDGDGRLDIVAGNWGRNTKYQSFMSHPIHFYHGDPDGDGIVKVVEAHYEKDLNKIVPFRDWETVSSSMPFIKEQFDSFTAFSVAGVSEFMGTRMALLKDLEVNTLESMVFLNRGVRFEARALPAEAQFSPVFGVVAGDLDGDGREDVFVSQNFFEVSPETSRMDAGRGAWLKGDGHGGFTVVPGQDSGLLIYGEGRGTALCDYDHDGRADLVAAQNGAATRLYRNLRAKPGLRVQLKGPKENPQGIGASMRLQYRDGRLGPLREVHAGGGYWSQDAATQVMGLDAEAEAIVIQWPGGMTKKYPVPQGAKDILIRNNN